MKRPPQTPSPIEWLVAGLGAALVGFAVVFLLVQVFTSRDQKPPDLVLQAGLPQEVQTGFYVPIRINNQGDETAADVVIEGTLAQNGTANGAATETSEFTLDYAPAHSEREGGLFFSQNPQGSQLELRAKGYQEP